MRTPVCDFVEAYRGRQTLRLHMPGHKGEARLGVESLDITEIEGADVLYGGGDGILHESEANAAALFGSAVTLYSAEGSSLSIRAMLYLALLYAKEQGKRPLILAGRNAHRAFLGAAALLDAEVEWLWGEETESDGLLSCTVTPAGLSRRLAELGEEPVAVYLTCPDYLGNTVDVAALAEVCHKRGILLLIDNAHGAYLRFLPCSLHPMDLEADACCDSAHKTLPALTGAGYLHLSRRAPSLFLEQAERAMGLFASTSPSYLILQSLDGVNRYLAEGYRERLAAFVSAVDEWKARLVSAGFSLVGDEPLKLTVATKPYGYFGTEVASYLEKAGLICECADRDHAVMMLTPELGEEALKGIGERLLALPRRAAIVEPIPRMVRGERACSIREALMTAGKELAIEDCVGKVLADATVSCPPAVPIVVCGEVITEGAVECMRYYGMDKCRVL